MPLDFPNSPTNGDTYTASGKTWEWNGTSWILRTLAINTSLSTGLSDVVITSATSGQFLKWDGTSWVNAVIPPSGGLSTTTEGAIMIMDIGS